MTRSSLLRLLPETKFPKLSTGDASGDLEDIVKTSSWGGNMKDHRGSDGPLFARPGCSILGRLMLIDDIDWDIVDP